MSTPVPNTNLFDPALYADVRRPLAEARTLPAWCYTSPEWHAREIERCFASTWSFVGHASEIAKAGDYLSVDLAVGPALVLRGSDDQLRGFVNSCRHRGSRLLAEGAGTIRRAIVCPYHSWTYGLAGELVGAPGMKATAGFRREDWGLVPLRLETWQGLMFVNADPAAPPLVDHLGDFAEKFACYAFADMAVARRSSYEVGCNWKLLAENAMEEYHTGTVHRGSLGQQHSVPEETRGAWDALYIPQATSIAVLPGETPPFPPIATLTGRPAAGSYFTMVYPNTQFACTQDCMWCVTFQPLAPERTRIKVGFCFPQDTLARPDFEHAAAKYFERWTVSIGEDNAIGEIQQQGLRTALRPPGPMAAREFAVHRVYQWLLDRMLDGRDAQTASG